MTQTLEGIFRCDGICQGQRRLTEYVNSEQNLAQCLDAKAVFPRWTKSARARESIGCVRTEFAHGKRIRKVQKSERGSGGSRGGGEGDYCELTLVFPDMLFNTELIET
jgi:hypothetical protein